MANPKTLKKRTTEMKKLCQECRRNPDSCIYLKYRENKAACIWRLEK